jgi:hypothetical protein
MGERWPQRPMQIIALRRSMALRTASLAIHFNRPQHVEAVVGP